MSYLAYAINGMGAVLLPVAAALLFEELTFGGLVRLLMASRPEDRKRGEPKTKDGGGRCLR